MASSEDLLLGVVHAVQVDGHQQRADLVVGDTAARDALDEEIDFLTRELFAVTFFSDDVLRSQIVSPFKKRKLLVCVFRIATVFELVCDAN